MQERPVINQSNQVESLISTNAVLRNTYLLLALTLAFSAVTATISVMMNIPQIAALGLSILGFILIFVVNATANSSKGLIAVFAFTGVMGAALGPMLGHYLALPNGPELVLQALGGTAIVFFALSGYALSSRKDFSFLGGFLFIGLIVVVIASIANIFFAIPAVSLAISAAVIFIMSGLILFDTSRIINGGETNYIRATVSLYLNIYNIFVHLLSLLGIFGDD